MKITSIEDPYSVHYTAFSGNVYTLDTASITLTAGTLTAEQITSTDDITATGTVQGEQITSTDDITMNGHLLKIGDAGTAVDSVIRFTGSAAYGNIIYDESDDEFDIEDADFTTTGLISAGQCILTSTSTPLSVRYNATYKTDISTNASGHLVINPSGDFIDLSAADVDTTGQMGADGGFQAGAGSDSGFVNATFDGTVSISGEVTITDEVTITGDAGAAGQNDAPDVLTVTGGKGGEGATTGGNGSDIIITTGAGGDGSGPAGVGGDSGDIKLIIGAFGDGEGSNGNYGSVKIGDGTTNFTKFEADGTPEFNGTATVWKDINLGAAMLTLPAASQPDEDEFVDEGGTDTGISTWAFAVGEGVSGNFELQHDYKEGSDVTFHVHWQGIAAPTGTDKVKWQLIYTVAQMEATLDAATTITVETDFDTQYEFKISSFSAITGTNFNIGDQFLFHLSRVAASANEYGGDALLATLGLHYEIDTVGSRQITTK